MKRPEINGWEVTTNENGIKMATLPRDTMEEILKYVEYADKQLRIHDVSNSVCPNCGAKGHRTTLTNNSYACKKCGTWWANGC